MSKYLGEGRKLRMRTSLPLEVSLIADVCGIITNHCCIIRILNFAPKIIMDV